MKPLTGKVAVITGAGRGIGRQHALAFAAQGALVVVNDPDTTAPDTTAPATSSTATSSTATSATATSATDERRTRTLAQEVVDEILAQGGQAVADTQTIGTSAAAEALLHTALNTYGRIDVLVNNAGILRDRTILNMTDEEWDTVLRVHLTGSFTCLRAAARQMKEQGHGGRILNTTSVSGLLGIFGQANYGAAKAGIHALTRIAALELAKYQITVNAIAPLAATRLLETMPGTEMELLQEALAPSRVAPLAVYLASEAAAGITGMTFGVEGNQLFAYRMMTTHGETRYQPTAWTQEAIAQAIQHIVQW